MKSVALVCASDFNASHFLSHSVDEILAGDGGYAQLQSIGVTPTLALGDFDSLGFIPQEVPVITFPEEKDDSDLGLALDWCICHQAESVTVYGAFAGRLDHTLSALQTMFRYALETSQPITGIAQEQRLAMLPPDWLLTFSLLDQTDEFCGWSKDRRTVSVIAQTNMVEGLTIEGLKYSLNKGSLSNMVSLGLSNELVGKEASIALESGCALVLSPICVNTDFSKREK